MSDRASETEGLAINIPIESKQLFNGAKQLEIRHGDQLYRLKITKQDKLILTK